MKKLLIKNAVVADPEQDRTYKADILCEEGIISQIGENLSVGDTAEIIDAENAFVGPGLVDVHVHFRDPGFTYKEDIFSGARAAAAGGYTSVVLMANTKPAVDNEETLKYVIDKGKETEINIYTCCTVTENMEGGKKVDMDYLYEKGAVGFTDDGKPILNEALVEAAMENAYRLGVPISFHEENPAFIESNGVNATSPREAEIDLIGRDIEIALKTGAAINIQHISSKEGVELVRKGKMRAEKNNIHAEATPHHFSLTEDAVSEYGTNAKMNPPLRTEEDRIAIIEGLKDGTIDIIATDHAPHSKEEKSKSLKEAPSGIIGLETALSLAVTNLVKPGYITINELMKLMSLNPAGLYGINAGKIKVGEKADLCIFNTDEEVVYNSFLSKSENTPFKGISLYGKVLYTIVGGKIVKIK